MKALLTYLILTVTLLSFNFGNAQSCNISAPLYSCEGDFFTIEAITNGGTATKYSWKLGDSRSAQQAKVGFSYKKTGSYKITLEVIFSNGVKRQDSTTIIVYPLPTANFSVGVTPDYCNNRKTVCIHDISLQSAAGNAIEKRIFLWGDGTSDTKTLPNLPSNFCHTYRVPGDYLLAIEIADDKGCVSKAIKDVTVEDSIILKYSVDIKSTGPDCKTLTCFTNETKNTTNKKFIWLFGDGNADSTKKNICYEYKNNGAYKTALIVVSPQGCRDTLSQNIQVKKIEIKDSLQLTKTICLNDSFRATNLAINKGADYKWYYKSSLNGGSELLGETKSVAHKFKRGGKYYIVHEIKLGNCKKTIIDSVEVLCPAANFSIFNDELCTPGDTTYLCADICDYKADNITFIWDLQYGAQCTTDTKNAKNIGRNCRYSLDEKVKHVYNFANPNDKFSLYRPTLITKDTVTGCNHKGSAPVKLGILDMSKINVTVDAEEYCTRGRLKALGDNRRKIKFTLSGDSAVFDCKITFNFDSTENPSDFTSRKLSDIFFEYDEPEDDSAWKTLGLAYRNGQANIFSGCDGKVLKPGTFCYDTAWKHNIVNIMPAPRPQLLSDTIFKYCAPHTLAIKLKDTIQKNIKAIYWNWGDGTEDSLILAKGDSVLPSVKQHTYTNKGLYWPEVKMVNTRGCEEKQPLKLALGYISSIAKDSLVCAGTTIKFKETLRYYDTTYKFWENVSRSNAGKEVIWWDIGDGNGLVKTPQNKGVFLAKEGIYNLKRVTKDSTGCSDTITFTVKAIKPTADFSQLKDTVYCNNNIIQFYDSSKASALAPSDYISSWSWDFGDFGGLKPQKNPLYIFKIFGDRTIKLKVTNSIGCTDNATSKVYVKGPQPFFEFASDSFGCVPFKIELKNTSLHSSTWTWSMGDNNQTILSTGADTNVSFIYNTPGTYRISLTAGDSVYNPITKNKYYCTADFPYPPIEKKVIVTPQYNTKFNMPDVVCVGEKVSFFNQSDIPITRFNWDFGDGATKSLGRVLTKHTYTDTGLFTVKLKGFALPPISPKCINDFTKSIYVEDIYADFDVSLSQMPTYNFINTSSKRAVRYFWSFGDPASVAANTSRDKNPSHEFSQLDTFNVCLISYNSLGCSDTLCKKIIYNYKPHLFIPNVITPFGKDTINHRFDIEINVVRYYKLGIYNRWGELVFEGSEDGIGNADPRNWNGTHYKTGQPCPSGTYYVVFDYEIGGIKGRKKYRGSLTLIRKD